MEGQEPFLPLGLAIAAGLPIRLEPGAFSNPLVKAGPAAFPGGCGFGRRVALAFLSAPAAGALGAAIGRF